MTRSETYSHNRAGRYILQSGGYKAFIPVPLPPDPPIQLEDLQALLSKAEHSLGRLDGSIQTLPNPELFIYMYIRKEAVLSSQIEGAQSSLQDVLSAEARVRAPDRPHDTADVINYIRAMYYGLARLSKTPLSARFIREIHSQLMHGARGSHLTPGELRTTQNWIGPSGATLNDAIFVPPPHQEVPEHLSQLETFFHATSKLPLLIKIGLAHAQFETIHPFLEGNGRIGRLLITFMLCQQKILLKPVLYLSHFLKRHRQEYYERLQSVREQGTWEQWLTFFLNGVTEVSTEAIETVRRILLMREEHRTIINKEFGRAAVTCFRALEYLYEHPIISVAEAQNLTGTTYSATNNLVMRMTQVGILRQLTKQKRNRRFTYQSYIDLFQDEKEQ